MTADGDARRGDAEDLGLLWLLRVGASLCFAGYAWQHLYWDVPYGVLLWSPRVYDVLVRWGMDWDTFAGDGSTAGVVPRVTLIAGWFLAGLSVVSLTAARKSVVQQGALMVGAVLICVVAYCRYIQALRVPAMWIEHGGQFLMPVLLVAALRGGVRGRVTGWIAVLAFLMTFGGHGAYAVGWAPSPGQFLGMIMIILPVGQEAAGRLLTIAGVTDLLICGAVLVPRLRRPAALYGAVWGTLTSLARPLSGMKLSLLWWGADLFVHEAVYRAPHAVIPLFLFFLWRPVPDHHTERLPPTGEDGNCTNRAHGTPDLPGSGGEAIGAHSAEGVER